MHCDYEYVACTIWKQSAYTYRRRWSVIAEVAHRDHSKEDIIVDRAVIIKSAVEMDA